MSQTQQTYSLRKEIGFGVELAMSALGEPHQIQLEDQGGAYGLSVITTNDPLASLAAQSAWSVLAVTPGVLTTVPLGVRKLAVKVTAINDPDAPKPQVFHLPGFFRGTEGARYYGVDQLTLPGGVALGAREWDGDSWNRFVGVSGVSDGRLGTLSFWYNAPSSPDPDVRCIIAGGELPEMGPVVVHTLPSNQLAVIVRGVSNDPMITFIKSGDIVLDQWNHIMASWEHTFPVDSAANLTLYINGVEITTGKTQTNTDEDLNYLTGAWTQGQDRLGDTQNTPLVGCLSEFYLNTDERVDLTDSDNRERFRSASGDAVNIGGDGSGVTGSQPAFYASNGELNPNAGYAPNLPVIAGAVFNCATAPTKSAPPPPPLPAYVGSATEFNAVHMEDTSGPLVSGQADGRLVTFAFWFKSTSDVDQDIIRIQNNVAQQSLYIRLSAPRGQGLTVNTIANSSNALISVAPATLSSQIADGWNHFMGSMEHVLPQNEVVNITAYFNGALIVDGVSGANLDQQAFDLDIAYNARGEEVLQGSSGFGTAFLRGCMSNLWVSIEERFDLTIQANREKFYSAGGTNVYLGANGELPTGSQPFLYAENGSLQTNDGYGPNLALIAGVVSVCPDTPPDP